MINIKQTTRLHDFFNTVVLLFHTTGWKRSMRVKQGILLIAMIFAAGGSAMAACSVTTTPVSFGTYLGANNVSSTGTVATHCSGLPAVTIVQVRMDAGQNAVGSFTARKMQSASGHRLNYNLYIDAAHTKIWGDGTPGTFIQQGFNLTIYGLLPGGQTAVPGTYNDTVLVTITW